MIWNPLIFKAERALVTAAIHLDFFPLADNFFETTLPFLFLVRESFFKPPTVLTLLPLKTITLAMRPLAMTDFFIAFFIDFFMVFIFMAFIATFIVFFIDLAILNRLKQC